MPTKPTFRVKFLLFVLPLFAWSMGTAEVVSSSDDYVVQVWDADSGLPQSSVMSIVQTPDGYLWLGTLLGGLARFDGSRFASFHPGNTPELKSIEISRLLVDDGGTMWVGGVDGSLVSYRNGKFHFEMMAPETPVPFLNSVVSWQTNHIVLSSDWGWLFRGTNVKGTNVWKTIIPPEGKVGRPYEDRDGLIWYQTPNGHLAQVRGEKVAWMNNPPGLKSPHVNVLFKDGSGRIWVGTEKELAVWDGMTFVNMSPTNGEPEMAVRDIAVCQDGTFWVRTDDKLRRCVNRNWLMGAQKWDGQFWSSTGSPKLLGDAQGGVWLRNDGDGLWHVDQGGHVSRVGISQGLPNTPIQCWCEDREGNLWVGLADAGLACIRPRVFHTVWPAEGLQNRSARSVCEATDGAMWFSTAGSTVLRWQDGVFSTFTPPAGSKLTLLSGGLGRMWVGSEREGLWLLKNDEFKRPFPADDIGTIVRCLCLDRTGALWIGSEFGVFCWSKGVLKHFTAADGFSAAYVLAIVEDPAGDIWLGTAAGELRRCHAGKFESFRPPDSGGDTNVLRANTKSDQKPFPYPTSSAQERFWKLYSGANYGRERFWALHFDTDGVLWIGSLGGGLLRFKDGRFTRFTTRDGLPNEHVSQILEDDAGRLWLGTRAGIVRVVKSELTRFVQDSNSPVNFITYGKYDGLPALECSDGDQSGCWKSRDGRLWFTTIRGAGWINPAALSFNRLPPPVQIEEVLVDGKRVTDNPVSPRQPGVRVPNQMRIAAGHHYFEFKFTALSFTSPEKVKFKWRLNGLEADWVNGGARHAASYSFLPPGSYRFEVEACNNDGVWSQADTSVAFTVLPYFWQTWWFKIGSLTFGFGLMGGTVFWILYRRQRLQLQRLEHARARIQEQLDYQKAMERERARIAQDLHDDLGACLTQVAWLGELASREETQIAERQSLVTQITAQSRTMVRAIDEIVWAVNPKNDSLDHLAIYICEFAEQFFRDTPTRCRVDVQELLPVYPLPSDTRHNLFLAAKEALHNVAKHAGASQVWVRIKVVDAVAHFIIEDDGRGFSPETQTPGDGLENMRQRVTAIGATFELRSRAGQGTSVSWKLPLAATGLGPQNHP